MTKDYLEFLEAAQRAETVARVVVLLFVISVIATAYLLFSKRWEDDE